MDDDKDARPDDEQRENEASIHMLAEELEQQHPRGPRRVEHVMRDLLLALVKRGER